ncbi:BZ3500_MvSof-1268-A1-R1_Chr5-2g08001 [Microbotryum saponariae]|uniref:BZ3500_MvSof-1268-A1-R1_Chr5-2g08001 protein n=1 Tax=Microbotryum saponariae TaxID=289078 RepID=A0A2X0LA08_9BASI|nr:BZ3500_MvSof-1268-A1-R1_Chr5-2g08001 [Microbotryum saponariae]SDA05870.1 BZ3501_MvSof-1269-A2-R1_Chr5-2g07823 [Microbotryum saponariae]
MRVWNEIHADGGNLEEEEEDGDVDAGIASVPAKGDAEPRLGDSEGSIPDESDGTSVHLTTNRRTSILQAGYGQSEDDVPRNGNASGNPLLEIELGSELAQLDLDTKGRHIPMSKIKISGQW